VDRRGGRRLLHRRGRLSPALSLLVAVQLLRGLDFAHRRAGDDGRPLLIVHCDVSPRNVLVSREGEVKLTDFGVAWSTQRLQGALEIRGTPSFMAPEQARGEVVDVRGDVFGVGAVLATMLTGRAPLDGGAPDAPALRRGEHRQGLHIPESPGLEHIVHRALAPEPAERFPTAAAFRQALEELALKEGLLGNEDERAEYVREAVSEEAPVSTSRARRTELLGPAKPERAGRGRWTMGAIGVAALLVLGIAGWRGAVALTPPAVEALSVEPRQCVSEAPPPEAVSGEPGPPAVEGSRPVSDAAPVEPLPAGQSGVQEESAAARRPSPPRRSSRTVAAKPGLVTFQAAPWAVVHLDGKRLGTTPLIDQSVSAGRRHQVVFENPVLGKRRRVLFEVQPGEHKLVVEDLVEGRP